MSFFYFVLIILGVSVMLIVIFFFITDRLEQRRWAREDLEFAEYENVAKEKTASFFKSLAIKYPHLGEPSSEICYGDYSIETRKDGYWKKLPFNSIIVWEERQVFMLTENNVIDGGVYHEPMPFSALLQFKVTYDTKIIRGHSQVITKTNKLGSFTRGAVGGLMFGYKGAVAGVLSTPTSTVIKTEPDRVIYWHKIYLTIDNNHMPNIEMKFYNREEQLRKAISLLKVIAQEHN